MLRYVVWSLGLWLLTVPGQVRANDPLVLVSIKPVHSLVATVMRGVGEPRLLVQGGASPHNFALRPSDARLLNRAGVVFRVGPALERFLDKPLQALTGDAMVVDLAEAPGIQLLPAREGGVWGEHGHEAEEIPDHHQTDLHLWLDPRNAMVMANAIAAALSVADPGNARTYLTNSKALLGQLADLDRDLAARLHDVQGRAFVVYHDAYQYFEARYGLRALGTVTATPGHGVGARRLASIRNAIAEQGALCVFAEPQFRPKLAEILASGTGARMGVLDPIGAGLKPGPGLYSTLMRNLAQAAVDCLGVGLR